MLCAFFFVTAINWLARVITWFNISILCALHMHDWILLNAVSFLQANKRHFVPYTRYIITVLRLTWSLFPAMEKYQTHVLSNWYLFSAILFAFQFKCNWKIRLVVWTLVYFFLSIYSGREQKKRIDNDEQIISFAHDSK